MWYERYINNNVISNRLYIWLIIKGLIEDEPDTLELLELSTPEETFPYCRDNCFGDFKIPTW